MTSRRIFSGFVFTLVLASASLPAAAATDYQSVTFTVPVSVSNLPLGATANVACFRVGDGKEAAVLAVPLKQQGGFLAYTGPALKIVATPGTGLNQLPKLSSGMSFFCLLNSENVANLSIDLQKSISTTGPVKLP